MKIKLNNGMELELLNIMHQTMFTQGANRDTINIFLEGSKYSIDEIKKLLDNNENTSDIILIIDEGEKHYLDYSLVVGIEVTSEVIEQETNSSPEKNIEVIKITLAQKTYSEKQEDARIEQLNSLSEVVADILGGAL